MDVLGAALDHLIVLLGQWWIVIALLAAVLALPWPRPELPLPPAVSPGRACAIVFALALLWIVTPAVIHGMPMPWLHDDYSALLGGEMVASGRTSEPPHPMRKHFETLHQLQEPRRASKYPPGQFFVLAAGIRLAGEAIAGEWLITALAAAAICWAAFAWLEARAALLAGLAAAIHPAIVEWGHAFRGGGLAAFAGALVIGSTGRLRRASTARDASIFAAGAVLLAFSRPYEGLVLTIACALTVAVAGLPRVRHVIPAALILAAGLGGLAWWNGSVTGNPLRMPYTEYERQYAAHRLFVFGQPRPQPEIANAEMTQVYRVYNNYVQRTREHPLRALVDKTASIVRFWVSDAPGWITRVWPILLLSLAGLPRAPRPLLLIALAFFGAVLLTTGWFMPHYVAPVAAAAWPVFVASVLALPAIFGPRRGAALALLIAMVYAGNACVAWWSALRRPYLEHERRAIEQSLRADGKRDLILVPPAFFDVVYNHANIDAQHTVWARDLGTQANRSLLDFYRDRNVWTLTRDSAGRLALRQR
jgi:hypothetical protein